MALPLFLAGAVIGGLAVVAYNNKGKITKDVKDAFKKAKGKAEKGLEKTEKLAADSLKKTSDLALAGEKKLRTKKSSIKPKTQVPKTKTTTIKEIK